MTDFFLASGNPHKVAELQALATASGLPVRIRPATDAGGMPEVVEDTGTFAGNARKKASALRARIPADAWALADDSGVCIDELGGAPGVESAYYAGPQGDPRANLAKLTAVMRGVPDERRRGRFHCVLVVIGPEGGEHAFEGNCHGRLLHEPRGGSGFGYDPLFVPDGEERSYAELSDAEKNAISHRARAWHALAAWWRARPA